ncbi:MAG: fibro-slime domain-containing protein [Fibromonadaceae bacterium]|jgi:fibro-slime domain-containing protein|nr:fibro-slime domain-containing protein [Fibromonadaceae bacterium]
MNPFKKLALTLSAALLLFAGNAMAQCGGKTVHFTFPPGWGGNTVHILLGGNWQSATVTNGTFTFPTMQNDGANASFILASVGEYYVASGMVSINNNSIVSGTAPAQAPNIPCSAFGTGNVLYIGPNPENPSIPFIGTQPPNAKYFYFLPPNDERWIIGSPYLWVHGSAPRKMDMDLDRCGWYRMVFTDNHPIPTGEALIVLSPRNPTSTSNPQPRDGEMLGVLGLAEDPMDWEDGIPEPIRMNVQYETFSDPRDLFFVPEQCGEGTCWHTTDPNIEDPTRCTYNFAAIIYHTSTQANSSFSRHGAGGNAEGLCRGFAAQTLTDGKMRWGNPPNSGCRAQSDWTATNFIDAFKDTPGKNVKRCYNMQFQKRPSGLWEFDASYLCGNNEVDFDGNGACVGMGRSLGGFYPPNLTVRTGIEYGVDLAAAYANCPGCGTPLYAGDANVTVPSQYQWCFDRGWFGTGTGNLDGLTTAAAINAVMQSACTRRFNEGEMTTGGEPVPYNANYGGVSDVTGLMCFESAPAEFIYEPGQEFFFRGDDDIWVFINNQLVIDLGGNHMPAPGYVKLDTITVPEALVPGQKYPINIFFCDRRATGSNVRIATNMYFDQQNRLVVEDETVRGDVCLRVSGGGSCEAVMTGTGVDMCGSQLGRNLEYFIINRSGTSGQIALDHLTNENCTLNGDLVTCYGGIFFTRDGGEFWYNNNQVNGLSGTWYVNVRISESSNINPKPPAQRVAEIRKAVTVRTVWGDIVQDITPNTVRVNIPGPHVSTVAGRPVPVGFATGEWLIPNQRFAYNADGAGQGFTLAQTSFRDVGVALSNLIVCRDPDCDDIVENPSQANFSIPSDGSPLVLYFTGNFDAVSDAKYTINVQGAPADASPFVLDVYQPRIRFVENTETNRILSDAETIGTEPNKSDELINRWLYIGVETRRIVMAFDPSANPWVPCGKWCNFDLTTEVRTEVAEGNEPITGRVISFQNLRIENGIANISLSGEQPVEKGDYAFFKVRGPSELESTAAQWSYLEFREPPVPYPVSVKMFSRETAGYADSLVIVYNKNFYNVGDEKWELPNKIEVLWDLGLEEIISYGHAEKSPDPQGIREYIYSSVGINDANNLAYWQGNNSDGVSMLSDSTGIVIVRRSSVYSPVYFSERVKTYATPENIVRSWATFTEDLMTGEMTIPLQRDIEDNVEPIIISAEYYGDSNDKCGDSPTNTCLDRVILTFSEPVQMAEASVDLNTAFAYVLRSLDRRGDFEIYSADKDRPFGMTWGRAGSTPAETGDARVELRFRAYRSDLETAFTPNTGDSVRFLAGPRTLASANPLEHALRDLLGNPPHPREVGVELIGEGRSDVKKIRISEAGETVNEKLKENLRDLFGEDVAKDLFKGGDENGRIELLPVPDGWTLDDIRTNYPGTVGIVFEQDVFSRVRLLEGENLTIPADSITFHAKAYYHTNLGNFVVKSRDIVISCNDPIFKLNGAKDCKTSSEDNKSNFSVYLAWDLKDPKGRWAGAGAYVQVSDFRWRIKYKEGAIEINETYDARKKIDMFGVKRVKSSK